VSGVEIADFHHDGIADLAVSEFYEWATVLRPGTGGGSFGGSQTWLIDGPPVGLGVGDFDRDGELDMVGVRTGFVSFLRGAGNGSFVAPPLVSAGAATSRQQAPVTAIDMNRDEVLDIVTVGDDPDAPGQEAIVLVLGVGDGTFQPPLFVRPGRPFGIPAVADLDRNGVPDLAVPFPDDGEVRIYTGQGTGTFEPGPTFHAQPGCRAVLAADLDGDGWKDLVVNDPRVIVLYNLRGPVTGVDPRAAAATLSLSPPHPNPVTGRTSFAFTLADRAAVRLEVLDVAGRVVRRLADGVLPAGDHRFQWNGDRASGERAAAGIYFVRLHTASGEARRRVVLLP
jgi:hypothetical protein